jgi:hypothetical protein
VSAGFYCVADERYFLGAVGLVNSLRLVGHTEPIYLLDCGLTAEQRELLACEVSLVEGPRGTPPWLLKTVAPLAHPAQTMALLDVDLVATRSLAPLVRRGAEHGLVAFRAPIERHRPEWGELLGLGEVRRQPYASSAAMFAARADAMQVLGELAERQGAIDFERTWWRQNEPGYAFEFGDQDVFNAILSSRVSPDRLELLDARLAPTPPFTGLRIADERTLQCVDDDGAEPYLVHHHTTKPWLEATHHGVYSRLLRRLLIGDDVVVRVPESMVPLRFRRGPRAYAERKRINARERLRWHVREPLGRLAGGRR